CETEKRRSGCRPSSLFLSVVFPAPEGDDRMRRRKSSAPRSGSLDILHLLAHPLDLRLHLDHRVRDGAVLRFRADSMDLARRLLQKEIEPPADRLARAEVRLELREVALEARQLLGDVALVGEERDLLREPSRVDRGHGAEALEALGESAAAVLDDRGR